MASENLKKLSTLAFILLTVSAVMGLRGLPLLSSYGLGSIFFYALAALFFLIPIGLVCAELASGWPKESGVYGWVKQAFGEKIGFLAIWLQWFPAIIWFQITLSFLVATICFMFNPALADNAEAIALLSIVIYWGATYLNTHGKGTSSNLSSTLVIVGAIFSVFLLTVFCAIWLSTGHPSEIPLDLGALIPEFAGIASIVFAISVFTSFSGMEVSAVRIADLKEPGRTYPKAMLVSALLVFLFFVLGTVGIAILVPKADLNLMTGLIDAFKVFLSSYGAAWLLPLFVVLICLGLLGQIITWISGPSKGLLAAAKNGNLPPFFQKTNERGVQMNILLVQGALFTLMALLYMFMRSVEMFYWFLTSLYTHLYLLMYVLLFASAIKLRYSQPKTERPFRIPFGNLGIWVVGGIGFLAAMGGILVGFFPPSGVRPDAVPAFISLSVLLVVLVVAIPFVIRMFRKKDWVMEDK
ncbi:MAG: APC family permease [Candidatus Bilamarchaeaceae archaeon]